MADTIFGSFVEGYKGGTEVQHAGEQARAETSLLSSRAELAKSQVESQRQAQATAMATRAAKTAAYKSMKDEDVTSNKGQIQSLNIAMLASKDRPEIVESLYKQKQELELEGAKAQLEQGKIREDQRTQDMEALSGAAFSPEGVQTLAEYASKTGNNNLMGIAHLMQPGSTMNVPTFNKPYKDFNEQDKIRWDKELKAAYGPNKVQATTHQTMQEILAEEEHQRKVDKDAADALYRQQEEARKRNKDKADKEAKDKKGQDHTKALSDLEQKKTKDTLSIEGKQRAILQKAGVATTEDKSPDEWFGLVKGKKQLSAADESAYVSLNEDKKAINQAYLESKRILEKKESLPVGTVKNGYKYMGGDPAVEASWKKI